MASSFVADPDANASFFSDLPSPAPENEPEALEAPEPIEAEPTEADPPGAADPPQAVARRFGFRYLPPKPIELPAFIETQRLVLRPFRHEDLCSMHHVYCDAEVMNSVGADPARTVGHLMTRLERLMTHQDRRGFSLWAVIDKNSETLLGDAGLFEHGGGPEIELGSRFRRDVWGHGLALEACTVWIDIGFEKLTIDRLLSFSTPRNKVLQHTLTRLGMQGRGMARRCGLDVVEFVLGRGSWEHQRERRPLTQVLE
ncbi:MAG: GNAT family N-acetyltransferase [Deltaproteobacteria bacterium]|nr:GNAT family N-acetyltransferase [Deltaproteobacteria bacterium]